MSGRKACWASLEKTTTRSWGEAGEGGGFLGWRRLGRANRARGRRNTCRGERAKKRRGRGGRLLQQRQFRGRSFVWGPGPTWRGRRDFGAISNPVRRRAAVAGFGGARRRVEYARRERTGLMLGGTRTPVKELRGAALADFQTSGGAASGSARFSGGQKGAWAWPSSDRWTAYSSDEVGRPAIGRRHWRTQWGAGASPGRPAVRRGAGSSGISRTAPDRGLWAGAKKHLTAEKAGVVERFAPTAGSSRFEWARTRVRPE